MYVIVYHLGDSLGSIYVCIKPIVRNDNETLEKLCIHNATSLLKVQVECFLPSLGKCYFCSLVECG